MRSLRFGVLLIGIVVGRAVQAQGAGVIHGTVVDQNGRPVENAQIVLTPGSRRTISVDGFDALGHEIAALTSATANPDAGILIATFVVRDTTIANVLPVGIRAATVTALKSGTTWIVAMRDSLSDSLQLVVR